MTQLAILTTPERRRFNQPSVLNNDERRMHFNVTPDVRLARMETLTNKAGFLLEFGYFQASARFYPATSFRRHDIDYVKRVLKLHAVDLSEYTDTVLLSPSP